MRRTSRTPGDTLGARQKRPHCARITSSRGSPKEAGIKESRERYQPSFVRRRRPMRHFLGHAKAHLHRGTKQSQRPFVPPNECRCQPRRRRDCPAWQLRCDLVTHRVRDSARGRPGAGPFTCSQYRSWLFHVLRRRLYFFFFSPFFFFFVCGMHTNMVPCPVFGNRPE